MLTDQQIDIIRNVSAYVPPGHLRRYRELVGLYLRDHQYLNDRVVAQASNAALRKITGVMREAS